MATTKTTLKVPAPPITPFPDVQICPKHQSNNCDPEFDSSDIESENDEFELFDSREAFTVEQDLFLVRNWCFQPDTPLEEIVAQFRRDYGGDMSASDLVRRLSILQTEELNPLLAMYLKAVSTDHDKNGGFGGNATSLKPHFHALLRRLRPSCETKLLQLIYDDEKQHNGASEMINIDVSSRNFPKYSRLVQQRHLERSCKVIRDLVSSAELGSKNPMSPHKAFSFHGSHSGTERLKFTDSVPFYDSCMVFNHLEQPILDRLLSFIKDPNVMERLELQKRQRYEQSHIKRELTHQLQGIFASQEKLQIDKLEAARASECESMKLHLGRTLEEEILHLRRMHEALLKHEHAKVNARFDAQIDKLKCRIADMKSEVNALHKQCDISSWNYLDQDIARSSLHVERIFGTSEYILRLLILAEDLDADPLRRALVRYLSKESTLPQFALRREFSSTMISESTVIAILKGAPTKDLREIEADGKHFVHHELVVREIHTRKVTFSRFIAGLTNDQLRVVSRIRSDGLQSVLDASDEEFIEAEMIEEMKAVDDFADVLDREFARRREFSSVKMNSSDIDREVTFSEDDCVLQLEASHRYCSVFATKERKQGESGKWMYEATVEVFAGEGESLLLGWEVPRSTKHQNGEELMGAKDSSSLSPALAFVPGLTAGTDDRCYGVTWQSDGGLEIGMLHANGQSKSGVACFRAGDVIGCTINQDELVPYLRFYLNGVQVLPPLTTAASSASMAGVACHNPVYWLYPVVSMYSSRRKPLMRVRVNFQGNFRFPIAGFEPYGAPL